MIKKITFFALVLLMNCGTLHQSNAISRGIHGADLDGRIYMSVTRSENYSTSIGNKKGEACQSQVLLLVAWGDASLPTAKAKGGLLNIDHVSQERTVILNLFPILPIVLFTKVCTIVYGN